MSGLGEREKYRQKARRPRQARDQASDPISRELDEISELVPEIGNGFRWYDLPYRALTSFERSRPGKALPARARKMISKGINYLFPFHMHDRNKARSTDSLHHNVFVPEDEHVNVAGVWLVELFPPTDLPALEEALVRNGWDRRRLYASDDDGNRQMLMKARSGKGALWWRLVDVVRRESKWFVPDGIRENLPSEFEYVELRAVQVGAGLTAVIARFHLEDAAAVALDAIWHTKHEPMLLRGPGRPRALDRQWAAFWKVQTARRDLHYQARGWLSDRLPGFFAVNDQPQPLLDLMLFDKLDPTQTRSKADGSDSDVRTRDALRALGISESSFTQLLSPDLPKLELSSLDARMHERMGDDPTWTLWGSRPAIVQAFGEDRFRGYGDDMNRAIAGRLVDEMYNLFVMLAVSRFLSVSEGHYAAMRDQAIRRHGKFRPASLKHLRDNFLTQSLNLASVHRDVISFWNRPWKWEGDAEFFYHPTPREAEYLRGKSEEPEEPESFNETLRRQQSDLFSVLVAADHDYREILSSVASLGASADSYMVSRLALWVSIASLVVALTTIFVSSIGSDSLGAAIWNSLNR